MATGIELEVYYSPKVFETKAINTLGFVTGGGGYDPDPDLDPDTDPDPALHSHYFYWSIDGVSQQALGLDDTGQNWLTDGIFKVALPIPSTYTNGSVIKNIKLQIIRISSASYSNYFELNCNLLVSG